MKVAGRIGRTSSLRGNMSTSFALPYFTIVHLIVFLGARWLIDFTVYYVIKFKCGTKSTARLGHLHGDVDVGHRRRVTACYGTLIVTLDRPRLSALRGLGSQWGFCFFNA